MARHSCGAILALSSDIEVRVFVTVISVAPIAASTCAGLSSNPSIALSATGGTNFVVVVVDLTLPWLLPPLLHPALRMQMPATASAGTSWRMVHTPFRRNPQTVQHGALPLQRAGCSLNSMLRSIAPYSRLFFLFKSVSRLG